MNSNARMQCSIAQAKTFLFVPANRPERISKAMATAADYVIADLEDAVGPTEKEAARALLTTWLDANPASRLLVRINGAGTEWHEKDVEACRNPGVAGVVFPKAESAEDISRIHRISGRCILPIVETAIGIDEVGCIASASGVSRLLFGKLDLAVELNLLPDEDDPEELVFLAFRSRLVVASKLAGLPPPVDGVFTMIDNAEGLRRYAMRGKNHGYGALLLIHPKQIDVVAAAFTPSADELAWAGKIIAALEASGGGTVSIDGRMVDAPVIARAQRIVNSAMRP